MKDKKLLPSQKAEKKAQEKKAREDQHKQETGKLQQDLAMTFDTPHGLNVLRWLSKECGFGEFPVGANAQGQIDKDVTMYNAMRLNLYIKIRKLLPYKILKEIEHDGTGE